MNRHHYYALLGLREGASSQEIKSAYRKLALKHHPDKSISKQDDAKFKLITEAYQALRINYKNTKNLNHGNLDDQDPGEEGFSSKIPYWNELNPEKIFKEEWNRCTRYAEMTYEDICKYEQELWKYYEKLTKYAMSLVFPSIILSYRRVPFFLTSYVYDPLLKKGQQSLKSKLKSSLSYVGPRK